MTNDSTLLLKIGRATERNKKVMMIEQKNLYMFGFFYISLGRTANLGLGFGDRSDSFDLNVALQDHFKWVKNQEKIDQEKTCPKPELDLGFKEGETIKINMKITVSYPFFLYESIVFFFTLRVNTKYI